MDVSGVARRLGRRRDPTTLGKKAKEVDVVTEERKLAPLGCRASSRVLK